MRDENEVKFVDLVIKIENGGKVIELERFDGIGKSDIGYANYETTNGVNDYVLILSTVLLIVMFKLLYKEDKSIVPKMDCATNVDETLENPTNPETYVLCKARPVVYNGKLLYKMIPHYRVANTLQDKNIDAQSIKFHSQNASNSVPDNNSHDDANEAGSSTPKRKRTPEPNDFRPNKKMAHNNYRHK